MNHLEDALQKSIVDFAGYSMSYDNRPLTDWLFHVPNGGKRQAREAARLKAQGVKAGVNDLVLPIAVGGYGGLWIELKWGKNQLTMAQLDFHQRLREGGQQVVTCWTLAEAVRAISDYLMPSGRFALRVPLSELMTA